MAVTYEQVRAIVLGFPGIEERASYEGRSAFRTKKRAIVYQHSDPGVIVLRMPVEVSEALCAEQPRAFYLTDHYRGSSYVLVRLKAVQRALLLELIEDAWRDAASKSQIAEWAEWEASR